jgi:cell filamentation protein
VSADDPYVDPETGVLRNLLGLRVEGNLNRFERELTTQRMRQGVPSGGFDLAHLQAIHRHLFQDVYAWAGELRRVEISKGDTQFMLRRYIDSGMADVHRRLEADGFLEGLPSEEFARRASIIIGDVNHIHPFREGNGRTQLHYLKQLAERAGHPVDLTRFRAHTWIEASQCANGGDYAAMEQEIGLSLKSGWARARSRPRGR